MSMFIAVSLSAQTSTNDNDEVKKLTEKIAVLEQQIKAAETEKELLRLQAENEKTRLELEKQQNLQKEAERQRLSQTSNNSSKPIIIKAEQPNVWTLEQAHYLLAQMHRRNLDLKTASLSNLDPNALNGVNIDVLKTLLSVSAEFDQSIGANNNITGLNNSQITDEKQFIATQRRSLFIKRSELQNTSLKLTTQIADLKIKLLKTESEGEKEKIQGQIDELIIVQEVVKEQITQINQDIETLSANDKDFGTYSTPKFTADSSPSLKSALASIAEGISEQIASNPQLNASVRLDNYIQMQYEILSKQLTLLRDEVGPGERLIFMELPQTVNVSYGNSKNKLAQSWWKIQGYSQCMVIDQNNQVPCTKYPQIQIKKSTTNDLVNQILRSSYKSLPVYNIELIYVQPSELKDLERLINIIDEDQTDFITKLKDSVTELKSNSPKTPTAFQEYVKDYRSSKEAYNPCLITPEKFTNEHCQQLKENYLNKKSYD